MAERIVGKPSTDVTIQVLRDEDSAPREYVFRRCENSGAPVCKTFTGLQIPELGERRIAWMHLPLFTSAKASSRGATMATSELVRSRLGEFIAENADGLVLDLRYCQSANLREAVDIAGLFVGDGPICAVGDDSSERQVYHSEKCRVWKRPMVVVVNHLTQCAAELLAAALQDYHAALVVGDDATFGKGTVTLFRGFDIDGRDRLKEGKRFGILTTCGQVYRPSGESIHHHGVAADIVFPWSTDVGRRRDVSLVQAKVRPGDLPEPVVAAMAHVVQRSENRRRESRVDQQRMLPSVDFEGSDILPNIGVSPSAREAGEGGHGRAVISSEQEIVLNEYSKEIILLTADYGGILGNEGP